jgi:pimeloyl-ACP methyl ester carboxylesterase
MSLQPPEEPRRVTVWDGTELCVHVSGTSPWGRAALVLANGLGGPRQALAPQVERFAPRRRVITWDYRGLYGSRFDDRGRDMSVQAHARDLVDILDALGERRAAIFGWSMGVQVAIELARFAPHRVQGLVLLNGLAGKPLPKWLGATVDTLVPHATRAAQRWSASAQVGLELATHSRFTGAILRASGLVGEKFPEAELRRLLPEFSGIHVARYLELLLGVASHDAGDCLAQLRAPTLVLGSSDDRITEPKGGRRLARSIANAEYREISWATHYAALESPDAVFEFAEEFLARRVDEAAPQGPEA